MRLNFYISELQRAASLSLAPGFSRVFTEANAENRFNGFPRVLREAAKVARPARSNTRLKPGANERANVQRQ